MKIAYSAAYTVELRGNASQLVTLSDIAPARIAWEPVDKRAMDIEVRISFQQLPGLPLTFLGNLGAPFIRWSMRTSHGASIIEEPPSTFPLQPGTHQAFGSIPKTLGSLMPGRGLHFRCTSRELSIDLQNTGFFGVGLALRDGVPPVFSVPPGGFGEFLDELGFPTVRSFPPAVLRVSFQPVEGLQVPVLPRYASVDPKFQNWGNYVPFPAAASEWRVFDSNGGPVLAPYDETVDDQPTRDKNAARLIRILDPIGAPVCTVLPNGVEAWTPIPLGAWALHRAYSYALDDSSDIAYAAAQPFNVEFR
jgi:hypothetical protein